MRPIDLARAEYDEESVRTFDEDIKFYQDHGIGWSGSDCFMMARAVTKKDIAYATDYKFRFADPDTWFVYLAAGNAPLNRYLELATFPLKWIAWHRSKKNIPELKIWGWDQFSSKVTKESKRNG